MIQRLAWAAIVLLATYLTFIGGGWLGIYAAPLRIASVSMAGIVLAAWFTLWPRHPEWRPRSVLWPGIVAALASLTISTIFSRVPRVSLEYLGYAILLAALYMLLVRLMAHPFFARRLLVLGAMFFVAICVAFLGLVAKHWLDWWAILGHFAIPPLRPNFEGLTYLNPSAVLTMAALFAIPTVALLDPSTKRGVLLLAAVLVGLMTVALLSGSRTGWLAIALTMLVGGVVAAMDARLRTHIREIARRLGSRPHVRVASSLVGIVALAVAVILAPAIVRRASEGGENLRAQYLVTSLRIFGESPIVGTGPGTWVILRLSDTEAGEPDYYIPHAHNVEAQTIAELGVIGAVAGAVLAIWIGLLIRRAVRSDDPMRRRIGWATFLGLLYFGFAQQLDFYANLPAALFAVALPVAYLDAAARQEQQAPKARWRQRVVASRPAALAGVLAVSLVSIALVWLELPSVRGMQAVELANGGAWSAAYDPARDAAASDPGVSSFAFTAGLAAARADDPQASAAYFLRVARTDDLPEAWLNLAVEQAQLGDTEGAIASLRRAMRLGAQRPAIAFASGDLALRLHQPDLAIEGFVPTVASMPSILGDPWWSATDERRQMKDTVALLALRSTGPAVQWEIALMTGDLPKARQLAATPGLNPATLDFVDAWNQDDEAFGRLIARCTASPLDLGALALCARIEGRRGDRSQAQRFRDLANAQVGGAYQFGAELRVAPPGWVGLAIEGNLASFWGTYTYRRATPQDMLVPGVAHLVLQ